MTIARAGYLAALALTAVCCGGMAAPKVTPASDDQSIAVRVRTALQNDPAVHANEISVSVAGAVVVLTGRVHGQQEANAAIADAHRISGVKDVRSELQPDR